MTSSLQEYRDQFRRLFGGEPRIFSAPGRVNLIGEHTDYNDGFVLPMAIDRRTYVVAAARSDRMIRCVSAGFDGQVEFELSADLKPANDWANHVRGMAANLLRDEFEIRGMDMLIFSDVPVGSGLSSSAALEIASGFAMLKMSDQLVDLVDLALMAQRAEQEFIGTQCGMMDQYIACLGIKDHALLIDCRTLEYEAVALNFDQVKLVVCNSMVNHDLASSEYNQRKSECDEAVRHLPGHLPGLQSLRDVEVEEFDQWAEALPDIIRRRANHVITENARTLAAVESLKRKDWPQFGKLMFASHESLREDYQVSCRELDWLVEFASHFDGLFGARMTGGGFGGCTINLVDSEKTENFVAEITKAYRDKIGLNLICYVCQASGGVVEDH